MNQLSLSIIPNYKDEQSQKKQLLAVIRRKKIILERLVIKTEMLRVNLEMAQQEYMVKVGNLFLKDNQLDLEIIRLQNIIYLIDKGLTYEQAVNKIASTYYAQQLELEKEKKKAEEEQKIYMKREEHHNEPIGDIKRIWKKLIARFHPDLVQNSEEKKKRDTIMKQINRAYQEGDYDLLVKIEQDHLGDKETSVGNLEDILLRVMNEINEQNLIYASLKESEWFDWMIKIERAKKKTENIFADTERNLLNTIVAKIELLKDLKAQILQKDTTATV
jgi:hypothetical protein